MLTTRNPNICSIIQASHNLIHLHVSPHVISENDNNLESHVDTIITLFKAITMFNGNDNILHIQYEFDEYST
jgi:hypothetical protein